MRLSSLAFLLATAGLAGCATTPPAMTPPVVISTVRPYQDEISCLTSVLSTRLELMKVTPIRGGQRIRMVDQAGLLVAQVEVTGGPEGSQVTWQARDFAAFFYNYLITRCTGAR
jgi:hypothetical protein